MSKRLSTSANAIICDIKAKCRFQGYPPRIEDIKKWCEEINADFESGWGELKQLGMVKEKGDSYEVIL